LRKRKFWIRLWPCLKLGRKMWGFWGISIVLLMRFINIGIFHVRLFTKLKMRKIFCRLKS
jgi:hypothetical protein